MKDKCLGLLDVGDTVYPRLVKLFYANLENKTTSSGVFFETVVKSVRIALSRSVLESIFGLKFFDTAPPNLTRKVAKDLCLQQFANPQKLEAYTQQNKAPPYHVLFSEPRLLHYVFVRIFYPKAHSKEAYNEIVLEAILMYPS